MPFPDGSLQNWGNAVRLRHAGGFTSWYFHIQANGVLVNVGDEVTQGQAIARSREHGPLVADRTCTSRCRRTRRTGVSRSAHTFGANCEQPATGATVTSDNAT